MGEGGGGDKSNIYYKQCYNDFSFELYFHPPQLKKLGFNIEPKVDFSGAQPASWQKLDLCCM